MKDASLDYDVDSEAEWEEGDDDPGEDVENDVGDDEDEKLLDDDEEGDTRVYNYQDGWLAQDDEIEEANMDDETKQLYKATRQRKDVDLVPVCIVAPGDGGIPIVDGKGTADPGLLASKIEGFPVQDAVSLIDSHTGAVLAETDIFLDAFPPALVDEGEKQTEQTPKQPTQSNEPSEEDMRTIATFVHHSTLEWKVKMVEGLRSAHQTVTSSKAQAQRLLESIAEKKRHPEDGVYWEVKQDVADKLGLADELKVRQSEVRERMLSSFFVTNFPHFFCLCFCRNSPSSSQNKKLRTRSRARNERLRTLRTRRRPSPAPKK